MKHFGRVALALGCLFGAVALAPHSSAVQLEPENRDAVAKSYGAYWNVSVDEASNTSYRLRGKGGTNLSGVDYGIVDVGGVPYVVDGNKTLTQGACNTLWGASGTVNAALYAAYGDSQATSISNSSPSTDITGGSDTNFKIAVDNNPVVAVTLTLTGLSTGAAIATGLTSQINAALDAAGQGARVDVAYGTLYTITSRLKGNRSKVVVTDGTSANVADDLKIGVANSGVEVAGAKGVQLCVSNVGGKTTVGATAVGSAGYMSCAAALPSATAVRQIGYADLNCTGPVIGTVVDMAAGAVGKRTLPVKAYGTATSADSGTSLAFTVPGLVSTDLCSVTASQLGTSVNYIKRVVVTAGTITATVDTSQSGSSTIINYVCY